MHQTIRITIEWVRVVLRPRVTCDGYMTSLRRFHNIHDIALLIGLGAGALVREALRRR